MNLDLARWQFGITTVFHFIFVPLTIGLALLLAIMQTAAYRTRDDEAKSEKWAQMVQFWRRLFLINFAIGVVTGIVQEFQFGMNWSATRASWATSSVPRWRSRACWPSSWSRPSWVCGSSGPERVSARLHLASIWLVSIGTMLSALFILAANSWMQHPVGLQVVGNQRS